MSDEPDVEQLQQELHEVKAHVEDLRSRVTHLETRLEETQREDEPSHSQSDAAIERANTSSETEAVAPQEASTSSPGGNQGFSLPNIESAVGIKILGIAGGLALIFAALFLVQLAIERGYIGPLGRVLLATTTGVGMLVGGRYATIHRDLAPWGKIVSGAGAPIAYIAIYAAYAVSGYQEAIGTPFWLVLGLLTILAAGFLADSVHRHEHALTTEAVFLLWLTVGVSFSIDSSYIVGAYLFGATAIAVVLAAIRPWVTPLSISVIFSYIWFHFWKGDYGVVEGVPAAALAGVIFGAFLATTELKRRADPPISENPVTTTNILPLLNTAGLMVSLAAIFSDSATRIGAAYLGVSVVLLAVYLATTELHEKDALTEPYAAFFSGALGLGLVGDDVTRVAVLGLVVFGSLLASKRLTSRRLQEAAHVTAMLLFVDALRVAYLGGTADVVPVQASTAHAGMFAALIVVYYAVFGTIRETTAISDAEVPGTDRTVSATYCWAATVLLVLFFEIVLSGVALSAAWGILGFTIITVGAAYSVQQFRVQGILLLATTTVKVFVTDMAGLDPVPRILSFIALGVILLITSYFYAKTQADISLPAIGDE